MIEKSDDGLVISRDDGTTLARVRCVEIVEPTTKDREGRTVYLSTKRNPLAKGEWVIHFTGVKMTASEISEILSNLEAVSCD